MILRDLPAAPIPMPELIWAVLHARGYRTEEEIREFLTPKLLNLTSPFELKDMDLAVDRLIRAHEENESVCVYGDYDLDGSSGTALLVSGLGMLGFRKVTYYQPSRFLEGYGIHTDALEKIKGRGDGVVVSVDCGITAVDAAVRARELELDLIITDHHLPVGRLPECVAVINPNSGKCVSGLTYLSGVGVGFYLLLGLKKRLGVKADLKGLLDLFSIGTITDLVPLKKENRVLVKHGLKILEKTNRPGLKHLIRVLGLNDRSLDSQDIAFGLAPKLNALSRLELGLRPTDLFLCNDEKRAQVMAETVMKVNESRKNLQKQLEEKIIEQIDDRKNVIVLSASGHPGVVGLVATRVAELTGKPTFIVAWHDGMGSGSGRGPESACLPRALAAAANNLQRFGGHAQAAGFSLVPEQFENLKSKLEAYYADYQVEAEMSQAYDVEADAREFNENTMAWLRHMGPFGADNPQPIFKITSNVRSVRWLKEKHLKLNIIDNIEALAFFARDKFEGPLVPHNDVEMLVEPSWNHWQGRRRLQFLIRDLRPISGLSKNRASCIVPPEVIGGLNGKGIDRR